MIAALSFLVHFLALGSIYSDWLDPVIDDEVSVANLVDSLKSLPAPPPPEEKVNEEKTDQKQEEKVKEETKSAQPSNQKSADTGKVSAAEKASLMQEAERVMLETLAALSNTGPATEGVLNKSEVAMGALDAAAASDKAVGSGN